MFTDLDVYGSESVMADTAKSWKEWEKPLLELEDALKKLRELIPTTTGTHQQELEAKVAHYEEVLRKGIAALYRNPSPWERVLIARAEPRPYTLDYISMLLTDFVELQGDRRAGADNAIIGGPARFEGQPVMVIGHQKGRNIQERQHRNFAMSKPEGYRKAIRLMDMAHRFKMPILSFIDTPAADPGVESESRGISEAIAASIMKMFEVEVPIVSVIIGEGGSGGAIGIAAANTILMQEYAVYSVIPPEGCAAILWRKPEMGAEAADALKLTSHAALELGLIDEILPEPFGAAHRDPAEAASTVRKAVHEHFKALEGMSGAELKQARYAKFRAMGKFGGS